MMVELTGWQSLKATIREPNYRVFTIGSIASLVGTWVQRVTIGWLAWELTESGTWLGAVAFADLFPMVLVTPLAGAFADRSDRLKTTRISQALLMLQAGALCLLTALDVMTIGVLLVLTLFGGIVTAFNQPARMALLPNLVDRQHLPTAVAINSIVFNTARFLGPMLAGVILVAGDVALAFLFNFLTFGAFVIALMRIRLTARDAIDLTALGLFPSLLEGLRYVRGRFGLAAMLLTLASSAVFIRPILELLPGYTDAFGLEVGAFALFTSVVGAGAIAGAVWLSLYGSPRLLTRLALANGFLLSGALVVAATTSSIAIAGVALAAIGLGMVVSGIASQTIIQLVVESRMRGRVLALHTVIFRGGPALGALVMGSASDLTGLAPPLVIGGLASLVVTAWFWSRRRQVWQSLDL